MNIIKISTDYIKLDQLLKFASIAQSGGEAKELIQNGEVSVNNQTELRRGRKIRDGDHITIKNYAAELLVKK